jgi:phospholipid/cholesterol/gamma-HCH transport system substrate-binding protein
MEVVVGGFMVLIFVGLGIFTIVLSREAWFQKQYALEVVFGDVIGLREGDNVVVRGMTVGKVKRLDLRADGVHVVAMLDSPVRLRRDYKILVVSTSILGGRYLQVQEGSSAEPEVPPGTVCRGEMPHDLMADAAEVANAVRRALIDGRVIENLQETAERLAEVAGTISAGQGTLGKLLSKDDTLYQDMAAAVSSLRGIAERLERGEGTLGRLLSSDDRLYEDVAAAAASVKNIAGKIESGEGMLGQLVRDASLYDDLKAAVQELRAVIDDYRETTPVVTFSSLMFGAF